MNDSRLLVAIPSLYNPANYGRFSVCFLSPGVSYPPVYGRNLARLNSMYSSPTPNIQISTKISTCARALEYNNGSKAKKQ